MDCLSPTSMPQNNTSSTPSRPYFWTNSSPHRLPSSPLLVEFVVQKNPKLDTCRQVQEHLILYQEVHSYLLQYLARYTNHLSVLVFRKGMPAGAGPPRNLAAATSLDHRGTLTRGSGSLGLAWVRSPAAKWLHM